MAHRTLKLKVAHSRLKLFYSHLRASLPQCHGRKMFPGRAFQAVYCNAARFGFEIHRGNFKLLVIETQAYWRRLLPETEPVFVSWVIPTTLPRYQDTVDWRLFSVYVQKHRYIHTGQPIDDTPAYFVMLSPGAYTAA